MSSAPIRLSFAPPLELWLVHLAGRVDDAALALLGADERARAARFHFERDRDRYVAAHVALRRLLAERTGRPPASLVFEAGPHGKPSLRDEPRCAFNLSHCEDLALVALSDDGEVGVDLERRRPLPDLDGLARHCLTTAEGRALQSLPPDARSTALLQHWTRKEACLKALGTGLSIEPSMFAAPIDAREVDVAVPTLHGLRVVRIRGFEPAPGWIAAVARPLDRH